MRAGRKSVKTPTTLAELGFDPVNSCVGSSSSGASSRSRALDLPARPDYLAYKTGSNILQGPQLSINILWFGVPSTWPHRYIPDMYLKMMLLILEAPTVL